MADVFFYTHHSTPSTAPTQPTRNELDTSFAPLAACPPPSRQRRSRTMFMDDDIHRLEEFFMRDPYPDIYSREQLAAAIGVPEARIQTWFQNKRSRTRRRINNSTQQVQRSPRSSGSPPGSHSDTKTATTFRNNTATPPPAPPVASPLIFPLQAPPAARAKSRSPPTHVAAVTSECATKWPLPAISTPRRDADDSGVLDLSIKSDESPESGASGHRESPDSSTTVQRCGDDGRRPFFTPWATTTMATTSTTAPRAASLQCSMAVSQPCIPFPFTPSYNTKEGMYYLQPLTTSPFMLAGLDAAFPPSPGLTPLIGTPTPTSWSPSFLSPSLRPTHFVFPEVAAVPAPPVADAPVAHRQSSPACDTKAAHSALSESPGSDTGSRSSGYSSRDSDSPIDVCN